MAHAAQVFVPSNRSAAPSAPPHIGLVPRSRVVRDFVLLVTVCLSIGLATGVAMMIAVVAVL